MNAKLFTLIFLCSFIVKGYAKPTFFIENQEVVTDESICLDIRVKDFTDIESIEFSIDLASGRYRFQTFQGFNLPGLEEASFSQVDGFQKRFRVNWSYDGGISLPDSTSIFQLCIRIPNDCKNIPVILEEFSVFTATDPNIDIGAEYEGGDLLDISCYDFSQCSTVTVSSANGLPGDTVCLFVTIEELKEISQIEFSINFDTEKLSFVSAYGFSPNVIPAESMDTTQARNGKISLQWKDQFPETLTLLDGSRLFGMCFKVVGTLGDSTIVSITDDPIPINLVKRHRKPLLPATLPGVVYFKDGTPSILEARLACIEPTNCKSENDGKIELAPTGGSPFYTFDWSGPNGFTSNDRDIENLAAGIYYVTVTDRDGVKVTGGPFEVKERESFISIATPDTTICGGDTLTLRTSSTEKLGQHFWYSRYFGSVFSCSGTNCPTAQVSARAQEPGITFFPDTISVVGIDRKGCVDTAEVAVGLHFYNNIFAATNLTACTGTSIALNGDNPFASNGTFTWITPDGSISNEPIFRLEDPTPEETGMYSFSYRDSIGCSYEEIFNINVETDIPQILELTTTTDTTCLSQNDKRSATIRMPPLSDRLYKAFWNNARETSGTEFLYGNNLRPGENTVTITNYKGCSIDTTFFLPVFEEIEANITTTPSCNSLTAGTALVEVTRGDGPFTYSWNNPSTSNFVDNLAPGFHQVFVTDKHGCAKFFDKIKVEGTIITNISPTTYINPPNTTPIYVEALNSRSISWEPSDQLDYPNRERTTPNPIAPITNFVVTVSDEMGCEVKDSVLVIVNQDGYTNISLETVEGTDTLVWCITPQNGNSDDYEIKQMTILDQERAIGIDVQEDSNCISYFSILEEEAFGVDTLYLQLCPKQGGSCELFRAEIPAAQIRIFPGDTNDDGIVNHFDLLNIGLGNRTTGPQRFGSPQDFSVKIGKLWVQYTPSTLVNYAHIDTDGNGTINPNDTLAITRFWGNTHEFAGLHKAEVIQPREDGVPLYVETSPLAPSQQANLNIVLGNETEPATEVYGIAFSIDYASEMEGFDESSIRVSFDNSWLGDVGNDMIVIQQNNTDEQRIDIALVRTDGQNRAGFGPIAQLEFQTLSVTAGYMGDTVAVIPFSVKNVRAIDVAEIEQEVAAMETSAVVDVNTSIYDPVIAQQIKLFPNPASEVLQVHSAGLKIQQIDCLDLNGRLLARYQNETQIPVQDLAAGTYWLRIITDQGVASKRFVVL